MNYKKILKYLIISLIAVYIVYLVTIAFSFFSDAKKAFSDRKPVKTVLDPDYQALINSNYKDKIVIDKILSSENRNDIASLVFDSVYFIVLYRIDLSKDGSILSNVLDVKKENTRKTYNVTYRGLQNAFEFDYILSNEVNPMPHISCSVTCDTLDTIVKNDSIVNYYANFKKLSIDYGDGIKDIYVTSDDDAFITPKYPLSICFWKRGKHVYLILMSPVNRKVPMPPDLLYKIFSSSKSLLQGTL